MALHRRSPHPRCLALIAPVLLAACGLNGTDRTEEGEATAATATHPDLEAFETVEMADAVARPQMQLQVVLDAQGFGPGVIDGREGMSTANALKGFQEANGLTVTGELDEVTRRSLARWSEVPATRVVRIPESWGAIAYRATPEAPAEQAALDGLGYQSLGEKLAERFHTSIEVLRELNPGGRPDGTAASNAAEGGAEPQQLAAGGQVTAQGNAAAARAAQADVPGSAPTAAPSPDSDMPVFRPGQVVRVPNVGLDGLAPWQGDDADWARTLASLGVSGEQPEVARIVVDKSESWLKAYDEGGKLVAMFTVTSGSEQDPLPLGEWGIKGVARNPPYTFNPAILRNVPDSEPTRELPPGPNSPVGVVWIDLTKEHYGIHGTAEPETIGRAQSNGCVRLTNWDAARLAEMVSGSTQVLFQA